MPLIPVHRLALRASFPNVLQLHMRATHRTSPVLLHTAWQASNFVRVPLCHKVAPFTQKASSKLLPSSKILYAAFAISCFGFYALTKNSPHGLESPESGDEEFVNLVYERYKPITNPLGLKAAEEVLNWDTKSQQMQAGSNILRYDFARIASNPNGEDYAILATGRVDEELGEELKWIIAGIFDGHAGWQTAEAVHAHLTDYLVRHIHGILPPDTGAFSDAHPQALDKAIKAAFVELDQDIMAEATAALTESRYLNDAVSALEAAYAGSCALISYYNSDTKVLKVACTGDSRAVLGRRNVAGDWEAIALSDDQTGYSESEMARLQREHPDEPEMFWRGRLLGLAVTRAFGDGRWKWSRELQEQARDRFFGPKLREPLLTPPYLTAEPVITTTLIQPENGDFLIQGSDGLWDELTSEQAVDLIGRWLKSHDTTKEATPPDLSRTGSASVLIPPNTEKRVNPDGKRSYGELGRGTEKDYIVKDENAAVHLVRNALGGRDEDRLCGLLTSQPPHSRNMRYHQPHFPSSL